MTLRSSLLIASLMLGGASIAKAVPLPSGSQFSGIGYVQAGGSDAAGHATSLLFTGTDISVTGNSGVLVGYGAGYGAFNGISCIGTCGDIKNITDLSVGYGGIDAFMTLRGTDGGTVGIFDLGSITDITYNDTVQSLGIAADGTIKVDGYDPTMGKLLFTTQVLSAHAPFPTSFSLTALVPSTQTTPGSEPGQSTVPEPASLMVLGAALAVVAYRRRGRA